MSKRPAPKTLMCDQSMTCFCDHSVSEPRDEQEKQSNVRPVDDMFRCDSVSDLGAQDAVTKPDVRPLDDMFQDSDSEGKDAVAAGAGTQSGSGAPVGASSADDSPAGPPDAAPSQSPVPVSARSASDGLVSGAMSGSSGSQVSLGLPSLNGSGGPTTPRASAHVPATGRSAATTVGRVEPSGAALNAEGTSGSGDGEGSHGSGGVRSFMREAAAVARPAARSRALVC